MAKILIVDDEPRIRDLIREHLQYAGFTCEEAGDGTAALSVLSQGGIDLVILDIMMPLMDCRTCLREFLTDARQFIDTPPGALYVSISYISLQKVNKVLKMLKIIDIHRKKDCPKGLYTIVYIPLRALDHIFLFCQHHTVIGEFFSACVREFC